MPPRVIDPIDPSAAPVSRGVCDKTHEAVTNELDRHADEVKALALLVTERHKEVMGAVTEIRDALLGTLGPGGYNGGGLCGMARRNRWWIDRLSLAVGFIGLFTVAHDLASGGGLLRGVVLKWLVGG